MHKARSSASSRWNTVGRLMIAGTRSGSLPYQLLEALMFTFLLWCILLVICWPLALLALVLYPLVWLVLLPFRIVGIAVGGVLELVRGIIFLPARILRGRVRA
jgi:hypothetical protein